MTNRIEPSDEAILAARLQRAYPDFSTYTCAFMAKSLERLARRQQLHDERDCSLESYSIPSVAGDEDSTTSARAERSIAKATAKLLEELPGATIERNGDPRGGYFIVTLPGEKP